MSAIEPAGPPPLHTWVRLLRSGLQARRAQAPVATIVAAHLLTACAASVPAQPAEFNSNIPAQARAEFVVRAPASIRLETGYTRDLPAGGRWRAVGSLAQGTVYRPVGTVFSIEGRHVHEAYLVIRDGSLKGFYLPAESSFSPLALSLPLSLGDPQ